MEFLLFPIGGLVIGSIIFLATSTQSRQFSFYILWLVGVICFVMSILTYLTVSPQERISDVISFYSVFGLIGFAGIFAATLLGHAQERAALNSKVMEERQYRAASEITQLAASNIALLELLNFALDKIIAMLELSGGAIHVFHRAKENLVLGSYMGLTARLARRLETIEFGDTAIGRTAKNKRLLIIRDLRLSQDYEYFGGKQEGFSYMALIPIVSEGENWGVISLFGKGQYQPGSLQVDLLEQFGEQLGAALVLGRQVRNMQASKESLTYLMKTLGQELSDISTAKSGMASVRGIALAVTRFFGGDRFDICTRDNDNWRVTLSSESGEEGNSLRASYDFAAGPFAAAIDPSQPAPFSEFAQDRAYIYTSLFVGREWMFIRLESKRRSAADFELLTDSFRIIYGLYYKIAEITRRAAHAKIEIGRAAEAGRSIGPELIAGIAGDLDRLIDRYSDFKQRPEMRELFAWLESIQKAARDSSRAIAVKPEFARSEEPERGDIDDVVQNVIRLISSGNRNYLQIEYNRNGNVSSSGIPRDELQRSLLEFITAAIFNTDSHGLLKLSSKGENKSMIFELRGADLAEIPRSTERPSWLRQINGRLESRKIESDNGQSLDSWRLYIPFRNERDIADKSDRVPRVLAIDTQDIIRDLLSSMLVNLGCEASVVGSISEANELFRAGLSKGKPYTMVIADYSLEKDHEPHLARDLKSLDPETRFILLTSWGMTVDPDDAARLGVDYVLNKPFRLEQLSEAIRSITVPSGPRS
jgi:CheY-like chemotaxis protein